MPHSKITSSLVNMKKAPLWTGYEEMLRMKTNVTAPYPFLHCIYVMADVSDYDRKYQTRETGQPSIVAKLYSYNQIHS